MIDVKEVIIAEKVVAIARNIPSENICDLARAILAGGLHCMEVTFPQSSQSSDGELETLKSIKLLKQTAGTRVGAGTVLTAEQVRKAADAGAEYIISPNTSKSVIEQTKRLGLLSIPGAMTPTEIEQAWEWGADFVKLFPASCLGTAYIKSVLGPLSQVKLLATGGVNPENLASFLKAGAVGAGVGGNLVSLKSILEGNFESITNVAKQYVLAVREADAK